MCPDDTNGGTVAVKLDADAELTDPTVALNLTRFRVATVSKLVPEIVTEAPTTPIAGENPVIVGAWDAAMVNGVELVADPNGAVTAMRPVVAPDGTEATS